MAAKHFYRQGFLLLLFNFISTAALEKRFSDLKRCADKECSMLLVRGKAVKDFTGPDCRFLSFKKSETIYVYYKLAGRRADLWAGSVGSSFGYFPNALLAVNHHYTDKELEVPAEETDFVCFDTGFDKFDSYDVDFLLGSSLEKSEDENKGTSDQIQVSEDAQKETQPSEEEMTGSEKQTEHQENLEDVEEDVEVPDDESASIPELESATELPSTEVVESDTTATPDFIERDADVEQKNTPEESVVENIVSEMSETKDTDTKSEVESVAKDQIVSEDESPSISEGVQIPKLKTTLGETFDAVTTDEDITKRVTPYEDEENENEEDHLKDDIDVIEKTPLLTYSEEAVTPPPPETPKQQEAPPVSDDDKPQATEEKNMWESLGDAVLSVVTGGETTQDMSSDEDEDDEEQESKEQPPFKEIKKDPEELLTTESLQEPDIMEDVHKSRESRSVQTDDKETETDVDSEALLFDDDDESEGEVVTRAEALEEASKPINDTPEIHNQTGESKISVDVVPKEETPVIPEEEKSDAKTTDKPIEHKEKEMEEVSSDSEVIVNNKVMQATVADSVVTEHRQDLDSELEENKMIADQEIVGPETETHGDLSTEQKPSKGLDVQEDERTLADKLPNQTHDHLLRDYENNTQPDLSVEEPEIHVEPHTEEVEDKKDAEVEEENVHQENEELLEDENALLSSKSEDTDSDEPSLETSSPPEPEYSDSVMRLTLLRDHFTEESMGKVQRLLGLKNLFKLEAMFTDLDIELQAARLSNTGTMQDIENALEGILEASENAILDEIEKMLDSLHKQHDYDHHVDSSSLDEETELLDDFQELAFSLRQKYSTARDSTPLVTEEPPHQDEPELIDKEEMPDIVEEKEVPITNVPETETETETEPEDNITLTRHEEKKPAETEEEKVVLDKVHTGPEVSVEEDGGYFNKNKDDQPGFSTSDEIQKVPQATLENPLDMGLGVEVENSPSGSLDSLETVSEIHEEEVGLLSTGIVYIGCIASMMNSKIIEWTTVMISLLPEEWKPGETLYGCPWEAVVITALIGVMTFTLFFWRTVLAVKKKEYLVDERRLAEQIQALKKEKDDALAKMSELQKQTEQLKENQKQSKETVSCTVKKMQELESKVLEAESRNKQMVEEKNTYAKLLENEQSKSMENESRIEKLEKSNEKLQLSRKKIQEALAKTTVLLDEAKIREDARNVQHKCLEKDYTALKEENKTLKATIKGWEDKHKELSEQIKSYQRSQKELEDSVVLKDHNVEVLSELLADLDACDAQKGDAKILANGEIAPDKKTAIKNRIKQMMDISRVQTTLTVVEEERDRFMSKLLNEEKARKALEEQHQELEHSIATLKSEKSHVENQFKILQQKNEIMVEMYQQKENALQQRLTKEELERRSKESMLSEVGGKALEAEEQVKVLRQRINEMEEQMKKTEEVYKEQIKEQENKTHSNWVNARNAERALNQEKLECSKLREKLAVLTSQLNERRAPLFRPNSGQAAGPRQGDSYGPSPVSGGAPSPPPMIEGPRRPPSAPVGRRIDPYGPRPPSDPHGRYAENKHIPGMDMMGPRSSSPANMDGSTQAVDPQVKADTEAEASTESPEPAPGSFLVSPIRDSPGPMVQGPPPPGPYRGPRPGPYHLPPGPPPPMHGPPLPANGHPGMPLPGPMGGEFGPRPTNGHAFHPRPGPGPVIDPRGPPPPHFRPPPPHHFGPIPPPQGIRGPVGPRPPLPPDMRFPGPRDHSSTPVDLPPGVPPHPAHPRDAYGQAPPNALHNSAGAHSGPGQDMMHVKQDAPQDSARPAMVKP